MTRQAGPLYLTGTIDDITFYKMEGTYYARKKSSLDRKQFRTDPRFARSRQSAASFGEASNLASAIYWQLPRELRGKGVVNRLTGQVGKLLRKGHTPEEVKTIPLQQLDITSTVIHEKEEKVASAPTLAPALSPSWKVASNGSLVGPSPITPIATNSLLPVTTPAVVQNGCAILLE